MIISSQYFRQQLVLWVQLQQLGLSNNQLVALPAEIGNLVQLQQANFGGNTLLLRLDRKWQGMHWEFFKQTLDRFSNYRCQSAFARFYQQMGVTGHCDARDLSASVPERDRNLIYGIVHRLAQEEQGESFSDGGDHQWGKHHVFDNRRRFCDAMQQLILQKHINLVDKHTNLLQARKDALAAGMIPDALPKWSEIFGLDNILDHPLMLIDAVVASAI